VKLFLDVSNACPTRLRWGFARFSESLDQMSSVPSTIATTLPRAL
jgi:hypothetical protein